MAPVYQRCRPCALSQAIHCERSRIFSMSFVRLKTVSQSKLWGYNRHGNHPAQRRVVGECVSLGYPLPLPLCGHPHACRRGQHTIEPLDFPWNDGRTPIARPSPYTPLPTMLSNFFVDSACVWLTLSGRARPSATPPLPRAQRCHGRGRGVACASFGLSSFACPDLSPIARPRESFKIPFPPTLCWPHTAQKRAHVSHFGTGHPLYVFERVARSTSHRRPGVHDLDS
jgi:hypothetical protein